MKFGLQGKSHIRDLMLTEKDRYRKILKDDDFVDIYHYQHMNAQVVLDLSSLRLR